MKNKILKIKDIVIDEKLYPRESVNETTIKEYVKALDNKDVFPPLFIAFFKGKNYLVDGRHRLEAYKLTGEEYVQVEIKNNFPSFDDIYLASINANLKHGLRLTPKDRLKIAFTMTTMKFALDDISKLSGINIKQIQRFGLNIKPILSIKKMVESGKLPEVIKDKVQQKDEQKIIDETELEEFTESNKEEIQHSQLENIYDFFKNEKLVLDDRRIENLVKKIKKLLKKKYPKL